MRKIFLLCMAAVLMLSACTPGGNGTGNGDEAEYDEVSVFTDSGYSQGFNIRGLDSTSDSGIVKVVDYFKTGLTPKWQLAQWWSKYNLKNGEETFDEETSVYTLEDESKKVQVDLAAGSITLGLNAGVEYEAANTAAPSRWPHLLLSQDMSTPMFIGDADKVHASLNFTVTKSQKADPAAAFQGQFAWFIYIKDTNPQSPGYNNFLWFGLNIYDTTKIYAPSTAMQDTAGGPGNYIYSLGSQQFIAGRVRAGQNVSFEIDILPHVGEALAKAQSEGFMMGTTVADCSISGTNIGWEIFDRWDLEITIYDIGVNILKKKQ